MIRPVVVIKNFAHEGPGLFGQVMQKHNIPYEVIDLNAGDRWPDQKNISGLLVMGGPDSANDETEKMQTELQKIREAVNANIPYLGVCLGLQTLVKAMGGSVRRNNVREIGCIDADNKPFTVELTADGKIDPLLNGLPFSIPIFHLHGETVDLIPTMTLLAVGLWCKNQIVRVTKTAYGIQGHWDMNDETLRVLKENDPDLKAMSPETLEREWQMIKNTSMEAGRCLFENFLMIAGLRGQTENVVT
ncbi:MAG TPA: type 1 glutamine amidotransferase [Candidatus Peribacterales bacterium]|nr:type 1 glutamine amidotransferase [Candidatus Peribacterales bacterium]